MTDNFTVRYQAGKDYMVTSGLFSPCESFDVNEVDVHINCTCGAEFDQYLEDTPIMCTGCNRIYKVVTSVFVGGVQDANPTA